MLRSAFSAISYRANIRMAFDHSKFAAGLGGTWSLAMEEQFYLVWPLTLLALLKLRFRPRTIMVITGMGAVGFALHRAVLTLHGVPWQRVYFAPDTRGDTLLIGCLLGLLFHHGVLPDGATIRRWYRAGALAVFAAFPVAMLVLNERQRAIYTIGIPIAGLLSAALIASCLLDPPSWVRRALEHPASIRVGQLSYSLYLWHGVMIVLAMQYLPLPMLGKMAVAVTLSWIASVCSYQLVEQPFLRLKKRVAASA
jgi:peptidoglycan/LPS O-acetylase OafA/YrhL